MRRILIAALSLILAGLAGAAAAAPRPVTILIGIDGFRADYLNPQDAPHLSALAARGVRAKGMRPSYPSLTFPNHYTLVTGLRPDHHGVVDNVMEDARRPGQTFTMGARAISGDPLWWDEGEPLWVTAERAGLRTATMFWPGSDLPIRGVRPSAWRMYDKTVLAPARVDQVLDWLSGAAPPAFVTLYFDDVDTAGHAFGPDSAERRAATARIDTEVGRLDAELQARNIPANLVIVADHGMAKVSRDRVAYLDDLVPAEAIRVVTVGAAASLYPADRRAREVEAALLGRHGHMTCWRKGRLPRRLHFGAHPRVPAIVCLGDTGWMLSTRARNAKSPMSYKGAHGFDPYDPAMAAVFIAAGPAFRPGTVLPVFDNVDVYPLLARLIGVEPQRNDGSLKPLKPALAP